MWSTFDLPTVCCQPSNSRQFGLAFICPFVVIDPTDLGAFVVAQALCLTIFNLSPMQNNYLFTDGNKANVCGALSVGKWLCSLR